MLFQRKVYYYGGEKPKQLKCTVCDENIKVVVTPKCGCKIRKEA